MGVNPLTRPFEFIMLQWKAYAFTPPGRAPTKTSEDQRRVARDRLARSIGRHSYSACPRQSSRTAAATEDWGSVSFPDTLKGEARAECRAQGHDQGKSGAPRFRSAGLGWLDETEIQDIPASAKRPAPAAARRDAAPARSGHRKEVEDSPDAWGDGPGSGRTRAKPMI